MVRNVIKGFETYLNSLYPDIKVECQSIQQGLEPPAFFINFSNASKSELTTNHSKYEYMFDIAYIPLKGERLWTSKFYDIQFKLLQSINKINTDLGTITCYDVNSNIVDNILYVTGLINLRELTTDDSEIIEEANVEIKE